MDITNLQSKIKMFEDKVSSIKGRMEMTEEQYLSSQEKLEELKELQMLNTKAIEILNLVQSNIRERIKNIFETTVTYALQFIHQNNDYKFELLFDRRGNIPKLQFLLKTPDMQEVHDIMNTRAGGSKDIVALALRFVLLEISKHPGFIFFDEPFKRLDNANTISKAVEFIKENQRASNRQMFIITHEQEVVDSVNNPIMLKHKMFTSKECPQKSGQLDNMNIKPKRKRGRPKKEKK